MWKRRILLATTVAVLVLGLVSTPILAVDVTAGFSLDKYKVVVPTYPGGKQTLEVVVTNMTDTPSDYLVNLRVPDGLTKQEIDLGYVPVDVLHFGWFSFPRMVTAPGSGVTTVSLEIAVPESSRAEKVDAWLIIQEKSTSSVVMCWAVTVLLEVFPSKQEASKHRIAYQGQGGRLVGIGEIPRERFNYFYLLFLLIIPILALPVVYISRRFEVEFVLLKVSLERKKFPVKVIVLNPEGEPIGNASIKIGEKIFSTDSKGESLVDNVLKGTQNYVVEHPDFETMSGSFEVSKDKLVKESGL